MTKPICTIPPIVSISPAPLPASTRGTAYTEHGNQRIFGVFIDTRADGSLRGVLELNGNWSPYYTCCGGLRLSALVVRYTRHDPWYADGYYVGDYGGGERERTWRWLRDNYSIMPSISMFSGQDASSWGEHECIAWGRAVLANHIKTVMGSSRRMLTVAMDRTYGHTLTTLSTLKYLDAVYWRFMLTANVWDHRGKKLEESSRESVVDTKYSVERELSGDVTPDTCLIRKARAYGSPIVQNLNSGNMLWNISVIPRMDPAQARTRGAKLLKSAAPDYKYAPLPYGESARALLNFYNSQLLRQIAPHRLQTA